MAEKYPRDREFVRALGVRAERAGRELATVAEMLHSEADRVDGEGDQGLARRIRREVPRRLADALDGVEKNDVEVRANWSTSEGANDAVSGSTLGIVFEADLANYRVSTGTLVRIATVGSPSGTFYGQELANAAGEMLDHTPAAFVFAVPVDGGLKVVPANAIAAVANDGKPIPADFAERLYARSLGRFVEELAECFVGDHRLVRGIADAASWSERQEERRAFEARYGLEDLLSIRVSADHPEHNLITDFE